MLFKKRSGLSNSDLSKNKSLSSDKKELLEALYDDISDALVEEGIAADVEVMVSMKTKKIGVIINNNKKITIHYKSKKDILNNDKKWEKNVKDIIEKETNKSSFQTKYIVSLKENCNLSELSLANADITINDIISESINGFICYASAEEITLFSQTNSHLIEGVSEDDLVGIPDDEFPNDIDIQSQKNIKEKKLSKVNSRTIINSYIKRIGGDTCSRKIGTKNPIFSISKVSNDNSPNPIRVFVFDTGIDKHPDLTINDKLSKNFTTDDPTDWYDRNGHGTHVAGTIGANDNDEVSGIAPDIEVISYKTVGDRGEGSLSNLYKAFDDVLLHKKNNPNEICIINMSLTSKKGTTFTTYSDIVNKLIKEGIIIIVAAGNDNIDANNMLPASIPEVITVGAYDDTNNNLASFSNFGVSVDILAPGVQIKNTWLKGGYAKLNGTSMATPIVTGAVVNLIAMSARNNIILNQENVKNIIKYSAIDSNKNSRNPFIILKQNALLAKTTNISLYIGEYINTDF